MDNCTWERDFSFQDCLYTDHHILQYHVLYKISITRTIQHVDALLYEVIKIVCKTCIHLGVMLLDNAIFDESSLVFAHIVAMVRDLRIKLEGLVTN